MSLSMYQASIPVFTSMLTNLTVILDKTAAHATAKKWQPDVLANLRLIPDMLPFSRQIQTASDHAKRGTARLAGVEAPKWEDAEKTVEELKTRLTKTIDYMKGFTPAQIDGSEDKIIEFPGGASVRRFTGRDYLLAYAFPHFFFHVTTAYAILRESGVDIGKSDYMGKLPEVK